MVEDEGGQSWLRRAWRVGSLGMGIAGSYMGYQAQNLYSDKAGKAARRKSFQDGVGRRIRSELQDLKGPAMKLGQLLSMQTQWLPEDMIRELAHLQMQAPAMHSTLMRSQFKASFGKYPEEVFDEFDVEPVAAASLGQVHRARTKGHEVAVKIQYPAIRRAIENDFKLLRSATFPGRWTGHIPADTYEEMERGILEETDYVQEASHLAWFGRKLKPLAYVSVPRVYPKLSTDRILTMSYLKGEPLSRYLRSNPSQKVRDKLGTRLFELFVWQVRRLHALHADPHPGNYLVRENGDIGLVDFGCVKMLNENFREIVRCFVDRVWKEGQSGFEKVMRHTWGAGVSTKNARARKVMRDVIDFAGMINPLPESGSTVVDFGDPKILQTMTRIWNESVRGKLANSEFVFFERAEIGLYNLLYQLRARVDTWAAEKKIEALRMGS